MSSLRNAVQRRTHRERGQPLERQRLGLLEKHKDYSLRAKDYNKKKEQLKRLRQKAAERNEDEFYFGMMSRKGPGSAITQGKGWKGTVAGDKGNKCLSVEAVRLLKTQDIGYVRTMRQVVAKKLARLQEQVILTRGLDQVHEKEVDEDEDEDQRPAPRRAKRSAPRKVVFLDDEDERDEVILDAEKDAAAEEDFQGFDDDGNGQDLRNEKALRQLKRELASAREKVKALTDAEHELEIQQAKMAKTATSGGYTRKGRKIMVRTRKR
ncbi:hypothetical protein CDD81_7888 [Ophiocordyceps australis]|uniref:U3 small nucleolar RNA-associated protein 11 n=1 Tax=Ophiocordyceps australis TaxID=1399860 RepID=A0A2C5Y9W5_9HYPO|nr:hypothetical protein CDD81_7888 [Ophiocordyceps australis]